MIKGKIHSIETFGAVDGPGIRTVFFMQGCGARCLYCHNPDSWTGSARQELTAAEIVEIAERCRPYHGKDGGVTFSGGEPLLQGRFLAEAMDALSQAGINSVIDTSGTHIDGFTASVIERSQMLLLDVKHSDPEMFKMISGVDQSTLLKVIDMANEAGKPVWVRQVIVPGINDSEQNVLDLKEFANARVSNLYRIELLGYHTMAVKKWDKLGLDYKLRSTPAMDKKRLAGLSSLL